jgi:hypothetical protein
VCVPVTDQEGNGQKKKGRSKRMCVHFVVDVLVATNWLSCSTATAASKILCDVWRRRYWCGVREELLTALPQLLKRERERKTEGGLVC